MLAPRVLSLIRKELTDAESAILWFVRLEPYEYLSNVLCASRPSCMLKIDHCACIIAGITSPRYVNSSAASVQNGLEKHSW